MEKQLFLKKLGENIKKLRSEKNWNQAELSRRCFKDRQSIERVENGKSNTSIFYLKEIAEALDVSLADLLDFD
jgi:putative transcriptional regulator